MRSFACYLIAGTIGGFVALFAKRWLEEMKTNLELKAETKVIMIVAGVIWLAGLLLYILLNGVLSIISSTDKTQDFLTCILSGVLILAMPVLAFLGRRR